MNLINLSKSTLACAAAIAVLHNLTVTMADTNASPGPRSSCEESVEEEIVDLKFLEKRMRKTKAIGALTKLKLSSKIKDMLAKFERYHFGNSDLDIDQLNEQFDLLYMKIVSLVQDKDIDLHRHLCNSWDQLWRGALNPENFSKT